MPCYHPLQAFKTAAGDVVFYENARFDIVANSSRCHVGSASVVGWSVLASGLLGACMKQVCGRRTALSH